MANNNMLNNFFGGLTGGAGGGGTTTTSPLDCSSLFDNADVVTDFTNHLPPVPGGATITQEEQGAPLAEGGGRLGAEFLFPLSPPPPNTGGVGARGGNTPRGGGGLLRHQVGPQEIGPYHV
jgi:hypothetical protein